jgi:hypothetical protein
MRGRLERLLRTAIPVFSAPLYIGKARDLRSRISTHVQELQRLHEAVSGNPDLLESLREKVFGTTPESISSNFAARAVASGFAPDHLAVFALDITSITNSSLEDADALASTLEWLLNTWYRPLLGRS